ncbi:sodium:calcium antiporter [Tenacibaculum finnmarkense]|uniref:sodium:calcium antiporter n=1 Tax=Tenacibaculum finnmarkense TaxID=2781243 RepID=UPI00187B2A80|nr:sodium:calcium antiporter [Tenacibaculum finnmarkense]MBE7648262.1 sodium:calcium antiporter [Tenacibaculum finnmarkense genomovar ulcerans]MCD8422880.1 sodium:calcium antiporter [Tenacibaculum finnmarkense genomovar ulcerans]MCD8432792.1 sodium:calcium antiporter [Tenacibaculum finnmarkense genomovar ulcerans]MCG8238885.1 sodium:calcium antiporter [Tenacibaculum finnmarkense genomovar ulcerans]
MILISIVLIIICCLIIWRASDGFEAASEYLGRNLSEGVRGATINAIGSSMPELFTTLFFLFVLKDKDGFSGGIGTTAGSAIFNGMIIPAVVILVVILKGLTSYVEVSKKVLLRDGISLLVCELVLIFILGGNTLNWIHGLILMGLYAGYASYMLLSMKAVESEEGQEQAEEQEEGEEDKGNSFINLFTLNLEPVFIKKEINTKNAWMLLLFSMLIIGSACLLLVKSCEWLGDDLNIPIYFIAVILASAATSVPDTILSMKDAKKGNYDDAVSNALGSNIFDVCFALGLPLFIFTIIYGPITMSPETVTNVSELRILLFIFTFIAFIIYITKRKMNIVSAILLLLLYVLFTVYVLGRSMESETATEISLWIKSINNVIDGYRFWK